ncbi:MAG: cupin domain-containing protein [Candidatus Kapaibacteriota bacterium]|jgi:quercetin dioxygenase-like cupin family protein
MTQHQTKNEQLLTEAAALALGALAPEDVVRICRKLEGSSEDVLKEYQQMVWTTHHLPSVLPLVSPPTRLKQEILGKIAASAQQQSRQHTEKQHDVHEFVPEYDSGGVDFYALDADERSWLPHPVKGVTVQSLATDKERGYATLLMRLDAGTVFPSHSHAGAEQCYVLSGDVEVRGKKLLTGSFFSTQAHADHGDITTRNGATVLLVVALEDYRKSAWKVGIASAKRHLTKMFA